MARITQKNKVWTIEGPGTMIVTSDLHGNMEDFLQLVSVFEQEDDAVFLSLGDLFHGPKPLPREWSNHYLYQGRYYEDESVELMWAFLELQKKYPDRVGALIGNHEHAHVGGPLVRKFHPDESGFMETNLDEDGKRALHDLINSSALIATSSSGLSFTHGAPSPFAFNRRTLKNMRYAGYEFMSIAEMYETSLIGGLLWRRNASEEETCQFLRHLNDIGDYPFSSLVVYGHDPSELGYSIENNHLINLSTSFWTLKENKKYLRIELDDIFYCTQDILLGKHLLPLYPDHAQ